jgi:hypothetical protein
VAAWCVAGRLMHGKTSMIEHDGAGVFAGIANPCEVGRYHSLIAAARIDPGRTARHARTAEGEIMGLRHRHLSIEGVQFHPESVLTSGWAGDDGQLYRFRSGGRAHEQRFSAPDCGARGAARWAAARTKRAPLRCSMPDGRGSGPGAGRCAAGSALRAKGLSGLNCAALRAACAALARKPELPEGAPRSRYRRHRRRSLGQPESLHRRGAADGGLRASRDQARQSLGLEPAGSADVLEAAWPAAAAR